MLDGPLSSTGAGIFPACSLTVSGHLRRRLNLYRGGGSTGRPSVRRPMATVAPCGAGYIILLVYIYFCLIFLLIVSGRGSGSGGENIVPSSSSVLYLHDSSRISVAYSALAGRISLVRRSVDRRRSHAVGPSRSTTDATNISGKVRRYLKDGTVINRKSVDLLYSISKNMYENMLYEI